MQLQTLVLLILAGVVTGCSSLSSAPVSKSAEGLIYYMPRKDIKVTVVREADKTTVTIGTTGAYADYMRPFVLSYEKSLLARTELKVGVSTTGLLTSTKSVTTPGIGDALKNLASSLGALKGLSAPPTKPVECPKGTFTHIYTLPLDSKGIDPPCGLKVDIKPMFKESKEEDVAAAGKSPGGSSGSSGIFYRQDRPYLVHVIDPSGTGVNTSDVVFSPSESPIRLLPVARTMFAINTADFAFTDGVPTKFDQDSDGEIVAALKIPADVIGAYFEAIGKAFGNRKDESDKEAAALLAQLQLELAKDKFKDCMEAIKKGDDTLVQTLGCGK
jgi:hypothetical protein